ncbi:hypothetical protein P7C70_g1987, partial [Phenoliferia sp. Uapishka_3]
PDPSAPSEIAFPSIATLTATTAASSAPPPLPQTTPRLDRTTFPSSPSLTPISASKEKESGWTLRGKKSVTSRIGRSLSLAGSHKDSPSRSVSTPLAAEPSLPPLPTSISNGHIPTSPNGGTAPVSFEPYNVLHPTHPPPQPFMSTSSSTTENHHAHFSLPSPSPHDSSPSHPAPPSDDGSSSTVSTSHHGNLQPGYSPQRRGSKASVDGSVGSGPMTSTTRNIFGRKTTRPLSAQGSGNGLGIARGSFSNGVGGESMSEGASLYNSPSVALSKKEFEKKVKEERKEEEKRAKERAKLAKEDQKRLEKEIEATRKAAKRKSSAVKL